MNNRGRNPKPPPPSSQRYGPTHCFPFPSTSTVGGYNFHRSPFLFPPPPPPLWKRKKKNHVIRNCGAATIIAKSNKAVFQTRTLIVAKTSNFWPNPCGQKFIGGGCDNWQIMASDAGAKQIEINNFEPVGNRSAPSLPSNPIRLKIRSKFVLSPLPSLLIPKTSRIEEEEEGWISRAFNEL